jgi:YVTN family beta-propeller protein
MNFLKNLSFFALIAGVCTFQACKDDDSEDGNIVPQPNVSEQVVFFNEGGFQKGNASVSVFNRQTEAVTHDVFMTTNQQPVGDVLLSQTDIDDQYWLVVNNSGKIWITETAKLEIQGEVTGLTSPRYAVAINDDKVYVSDLFSGSVSIVDRSTLQVTGTIALPGWTEQMLVVGSDVWITNKNRDQVYIVDGTTDVVEDSIRVRKNGGTIFQKGSRVFVHCEAEWDGSTKACLYAVDPNSATVQDSLEFELGEAVVKVVPDPASNNIFYALNGVHKIASEQLSKSTTPLVNLDGIGVYGLGVDPDNGDIYVSDALDFTNRSDVHIFDQNGVKKTTVKAGVNCNGFRF